MVRGKAKGGMRLTPDERVALFEAATKRRTKREQTLLKGKPRPDPETGGRGWTREKIYGKSWPSSLTRTS